MKRSPRKTITQALLFLLLGAIVNIGVAWGCALALPPHTTYIHTEPGVIRQPPFKCTLVGVRIVFVPAERHDWASIFQSWHTGGARRLPAGTYFDGRGWPLVSLWCEHRPQDTTAAPTTYRLIGAIGPSAALDPLTLAIPLCPNPVGFIGNTLFYATILWALIAARKLRGLRQRRRIKRGLCPACAYPVGTSDFCTECGKPVKPIPRHDIEPVAEFSDLDLPQ